MPHLEDIILKAMWFQQYNVTFQITRETLTILNECFPACVICRLVTNIDRYDLTIYDVWTFFLCDLLNWWPKLTSDLRSTTTFIWNRYWEYLQNSKHMPASHSHPKRINQQIFWNFATKNCDVFKIKILCCYLNTLKMQDICFFHSMAFFLSRMHMWNFSVEELSDLL